MLVLHHSSFAQYKYECEHSGYLYLKLWNIFGRIDFRFFFLH